MSPHPKRTWADERGLHASPHAKRLRSMEGGVSGAASSAARLAALIRERRLVVQQLLEGRLLRGGGFSFTEAAASGGASDNGGENVIVVQHQQHQQQQGEKVEEEVAVEDDDDGDVATQAAVPASSPHPPPAHLPSPPASLGTSGAWPTQDDGAQVLLLSGGSSLPAVFRLSQMQGGGSAAAAAAAAAEPTPSTQGGGGGFGSFGCRMRSVACAEVASSLDRQQQQQQQASVVGLPAAAGAAASAAFLYDTPLEEEGSAGGDASVSAWSGSERTPVCIRTAAPPLPLQPQQQQPPSAAVASAQPRQPQTPTQGEPCSAGLQSPHPLPQQQQPEAAAAAAAAPPSDEEVAAAAAPVLLAGLWPSGGGLSAAPHEWRINNSRPLRSIGAATAPGDAGARDGGLQVVLGGRPARPGEGSVGSEESCVVAVWSRRSVRLHAVRGGGDDGVVELLGEVSGWGEEEEEVVATSCSVAATRPCVAVVGLSNGAVRGFLAAPGCPTVFALPAPAQASSSSALPAPCPEVRAAHLLPWFAAHVVVAVAYVDRVVRVPLVARLPVFAVSPAAEGSGGGGSVVLRVPPSPPTLRREIAALATVASEAAPLLAATVVTVGCGGGATEALASAEAVLFDHATGATLARVAMPAPATTPALPLPLRSVAAQPFRLGDGTLAFLWGTPRGVARTAGVAAPLPLLLPAAAAAAAEPPAAAEATDVVTPAGVLRQVRACGAGGGAEEVVEEVEDAAAVVRAWAATPDGRYTASSVGSSLYFHATGTGALTAAIDLAGGAGGDKVEKYVHAVAFHPTLPLMCLADSEGSVWVYRSTDQPYV